MIERYASKADIEECRKVHKRFGTTYYYSTLRLPAKYRRRVHALYAFVRVPDEWVDNPGDMTREERLANLADWRRQFDAGMAGTCPQHFAMRAFCDTVRECRIPVEEAHIFLDAMEQDLFEARYETYEELRGYMRGSASAIGVMMCYAMCARTDYDTIARAKALGEAMQLTNFIRDVGEDLRTRGRIYLPLEDLRRFGVTERDMQRGVVTPEIRQLLQFEIDRARALYTTSDFGIYKLPKRMRRAVLIARILYSDILTCVERNQYDVFNRRARTSRWRKLSRALHVAAGEERILTQFVAASGLQI